MLELVERAPRDAQPTATLTLPWDRRGVTRQRVRLDDGRDAGVFLARGEILRGGDRLATASGEVVEIVAAPQSVLVVRAATPTLLARAAYHLGNRHVPVQVGEGWLRITDDHVLARMLDALGARLSVVEAAFEPEAGAYGAGHHHHDNESTHGGRIHDFARDSSPRAPQSGNGPGPK